METKTVAVDGIRTSYVEAGAGPPVLFIHGLGGFKENWEDTLPAFSGRFRAIALDLPGFGRSEKPDVPYGPPWFAAFVVKFLGTLGIPRAHLVGQSMGGHIASILGANHPDVADRIILVDPTGVRGQALAAQSPIQPEMIEAMGPFNPGEDFVRMYVEMQFFKQGDYTEKLVQRALADFELGENEARFHAFLKSLRALIAHDMEPRYREIAAPSLVVWGENDAIVPIEHAGIIAAALPRGKKALFPACGHCPMIEQPEAFNRIALEFLA
jgi:pimeloyl-ACP methyl ester carboxylesterase